MKNCLRYIGLVLAYYTMGLLMGMLLDDPNVAFYVLTCMVAADLYHGRDK